MLGQSIEDPEGIEGAAGKTNGLGLLDVNTVMVPQKHLVRVTGTDPDSGAAVTGYEIHNGTTMGTDCEHPMLEINGKSEGARSGRVSGCYIHGLFTSDAYRTAFLKSFGAASSVTYSSEIEAVLDSLANHLEEHLAVEGMITLARKGL